MKEPEREPQNLLVRIDSFEIDVIRIAAACAILGLSGCGDKVLDLGHDQGRVDGPHYATREELAAADSAEPSVPTVIATHQPAAVTIAIDETRVYWATWGWLPGQCPQECSVVRSCAKTDCAGTVITYAFLQGTPQYLAVNGTSVFWVTSGQGTPSPQIVACPIAGCDGPPKEIATDTFPNSLAADDTHVYWLSANASLVLQRCPVQGCVRSPDVVASLEQSPIPASLILDADHLYWLTAGGVSTRSGIAMIPKDGSGPYRLIADGLISPSSIAVQGETVYWSEYDSAGSVKSSPVAGCASASTVLASSLALSALLDVDGDRAYWFLSTGTGFGLPGQDGSAQLVECSVHGCGSSPTVLASEPHGPTGLAVDATHIYWASSGEKKMTNQLDEYSDGTIKRVRRPH